MITAQFAYGLARVRARKARLWTRDDVLVRLADRRPTRETRNELYAALSGDYALALRGYPGARSLLTALFRRHEIENVKLAWRACARTLPAERWRQLWRPLSPLATVPLAAVESAVSLASLVHALRRTPYAACAAAALDAHARDPVAAELVLERWTYAELLRQARALPRRESAAAALVFDVIRERDLDRVGRGAGAYGLAPALAAALAAMPGVAPPTDASRVEADRASVRRERRRRCLRAFVGGEPFVLAPVVAHLLLREAEMAVRLALASGHAARAAAAFERIAAASLAGA